MGELFAFVVLETFRFVPITGFIQCNDRSNAIFLFSLQLNFSLCPIFFCYHHVSLNSSIAVH